MKPAYAGSCLACGTRNAALTSHCVDCACAAMATGVDAQGFRARHVARGGVVLPGAAIESPPLDPDVTRALWRTLFGVPGLAAWT